MKRMVLFGLAAVFTAACFSSAVLFSGRPAPSAFAAEKAKKYICPMHPDYVSDRPGDCPICHMRLVPAEAGGSPAADDPKAVCLMHNCPMEKNGQPCNMLVLAEKGEKVTCPVCQQAIDASKAKSLPAAPTGPRRIKFYRNPMDPGVTSPVPAKDPMGMDYVPVYEEDAPSSAPNAPAGYAAVLVSPEKQQMIGLRKSPAAKKRFLKTIRASARVAHDPELYQTEAEYLQSLKTQESSQGADWAKRLVEGARLKLLRMGVSDEMVAELEKSGEPDRSLLYADPEHGAWVYANIYEYELPYVKVGDELNVEIPSQPGQAVSGRVRAIDPTVDATTRTVRVRALVPNPRSEFKPDLYVTAVLSSDLGERIAIPSEAVFYTGKDSVVFVDKGQGLLEPRRIVVGARGDGEVEVVSGIQEGESVVTNGNFLIDSESRLRSALGASAAP